MISYHAMIFARECHKEQRRKYTNNPYFDHLAEVVGITSTVISSPETLAIAWLHDTIEDCGVTYKQLKKEFNLFIANGVMDLSDLETDNRAERKVLSRERLAKAPEWIQTIKVADLISNTSSIVEHDPKFSVTYLEEKRLLLDVLTKADPLLLSIARELAR